MSTTKRNSGSENYLSIRHTIVVSIFLFTLVFFTTGCSLVGKVHMNGNYVVHEKSKAAFVLAENGNAAPMFVSDSDFAGVKRVMGHLQADIKRVTGVTPDLTITDGPRGSSIIIAGTLGKSALVEKLVQNKKLDTSVISGKREVFLIQAVNSPLPGIDNALVIVGSDKRGTIYGIYDLAEKMGVSPWYWWADVPAKTKENVYIAKGVYSITEPKVRYRGIFINDENPALLGWANEKFGGFNAKMYEHMFELIMRLKGNFLWPAMWGKAFYDDDPENPRLADEYGVVISTSHHEPMMRAHDEWSRYGTGPWNYEKNKKVLKKFWTRGIERMNGYESIVTLAMRGDGDAPMSADANIELLQRIVKDQREIITSVTGKEITEVPQVWALYKEVQEYYDRGMRVPDDITLLLCDDNWGNIRKLPKLNEKPRAGGYGIYYHYDYVGGPRNYKWLNTNPVARVWEQMNLAWEYKADRIWLVNVGDLKPMEFPIEFFLDFAWDPDAIKAENLPEYTRRWTEEQFGAEFASETADIMTDYLMYSSRRTPEMLMPGTYSLQNYNEAENIVKEYDELNTRATKVYEQLLPEYKDSYYQLVLHPIEALLNLNDLYVTIAKNRLYAKQGRMITNYLAEKAKNLFQHDQEITDFYNNVMAGGKWDHIMDQTHIGYIIWQQPEVNSMPRVKEIEIPVQADMGVSIEGSDSWWPNSSDKAVLPELGPCPQGERWIEVFNRGQGPFDLLVAASEPWIVLSETIATISDQIRLWVSVDWESVPAGKHDAVVTFTGPNNVKVDVTIPVHKPQIDMQKIKGFVESNGYVSIEAEHYSHAVNGHSVRWLNIPDLGRTKSGMTVTPAAIAPIELKGNSPHLEYDMYLFNTGTVKVNLHLSPTLDFHNKGGLRFAVSIDDGGPQIVNMHEGMNNREWEKWVGNSIAVLTTELVVDTPGEHVLKFWVIDPGVVLQKIVVETTGAAPSYLGPPESCNSAMMSDRK